MKTKLSTNTLHVSAADAYRRARNCRIHSKLSPWTAERELRSAAYWVESARFWKAEAAREAAPAPIIEERRWLRSVTWEAELEHLLGCPVAIAAEVE